MSLLISTAYLPPLAYISAGIKEEVFRIEIHETFPKQTCRNHCRIYGPNGIQVLSVPVIRTSGNHTQTRDVRISYSLPWQKTHWKSIETAYNNSPFFLFYQDYFEPVFHRKYNFLIDLNAALLETIFSALKVSTQILYTDHFTKFSSRDPREYLVSKKYQLFLPPYHQVFASKSGFISNLSLIDALFNLGPETLPYLKSL